METRSRALNYLSSLDGSMVGVAYTSSVHTSLESRPLEKRPGFEAMYTQTTNGTKIIIIAK